MAGRLRQLHRENELLELALRMRVRASVMRQLAATDDEIANRLEELGKDGP